MICLASCRSSIEYPSIMRAVSSPWSSLIILFIIDIFLFKVFQYKIPIRTNYLNRVVVIYRCDLLLFYKVDTNLPLFHPIHHAEGLAVALELAFGTIEEITYFNIGALILRIGGLKDFLQSGRDIFQSHPLATIWIGPGRSLGFLEK